MAWTTPPTWATTSGISYAALNTYFRDNLLSIRNNNDRLVHCSRNTTQALGTTNFTAVSWNVHDYIVGSTAIHTTASGSKFHAPDAGWYRLLGTMVFNAASGSRSVQYQLNGATAAYKLNFEHVGAAGIAREFLMVDTVQMTTADYLEIYAKADPTTTNIIGGTTGSRIGWYMIGAST